MNIEKCPLLVEVVDGEGGMSVKRVKSRGRGRVLAHGAAALIDKWPDNLSRCWLTTLLFSLSFLGMCIAINAFAERPLSLRIVEHITPLTIMLDNDTTEIHQTSTHASIVRRESNIYIEEISCHLFVNPVDIFPIHKYLKYLSLLAVTYPTYRFNVYVLTNDTKEYAYNNEVPVSSWELIDDVYDRLSKNYAVKSREEFDRFAEKYANVKFLQMKLSEYFEESPLKRTWYKVSYKIIPFLIRVVSVWEKGGISFDLETLNTDQSSYKNKGKIYEFLDSLGDQTIEERELKRSVVTAFTQPRSTNTDRRKHRISKRANPVVFVQESLLYKVPINSQVIMLYVVSNASNVHSNTLTSPHLSGSKVAIKNDRIQHPRLANKYDYKHFEFPFLKRKNPHKFHVKKRDLISKSTQKGHDTVVTLSREGNVIATTTHCHALLAQIFSCLRTNTALRTSEELIDQALSIFCNLAPSSQFKRCPGVRILA